MTTGRTTPGGSIAGAPATPGFASWLFASGGMAFLLMGMLSALYGVALPEWSGIFGLSEGLHPSLAETYRTRMRDLVAGLADAEPGQALEAREAIRALVDRLVLTPSPEDPTVPTVDLEGSLAGLLALATARGGVGSNANKAAPLPEAALQSVLVAGAGFEPAAFRL